MRKLDPWHFPDASGKQLNSNAAILIRKHLQQRCTSTMEISPPFPASLLELLKHILWAVTFSCTMQAYALILFCKPGNCSDERLAGSRYSSGIHSLFRLR